MYFPTCLSAVLALSAHIVHSSGQQSSTNPQRRQQRESSWGHSFLFGSTSPYSVDCLDYLKQPPQDLLQLCQSQGNVSSICWPQPGAKLCYPRTYSFYWSPAYFQGIKSVGLFLEDPSNFTAQQVLLTDQTKLNQAPANTSISFNQTYYDTLGATKTFQVWAVGATLGDNNITVAHEPATYTLEYSPLPTMPDSSTDDAGLAVSTVSVIVVAIVAVIFLVAFVSFCCCGCCRIRRARPESSGSANAVHRSSGFGTVPLYRVSPDGTRIYRPDVQIPGFPRARLSDPRRQGVHDYIDEQLPAYRKERDGESPPAYDHPTTGSDETPGQAQSTQQSNDNGEGSHTAAGQTSQDNNDERATENNVVSDADAPQRANNAS